MKKLLLLPWVAIGLALVPINKLTLRFQSGSDQSESDSVTPHIDTATTDSGPMLPAQLLQLLRGLLI